MSPPAGREASKKNPGRRPERPCFLCLAPDCESLCPHCRAVYYCGEEHFRLHRLPDADYCFPYEADYMDGVGRILRATRPIKALEIVLVDPGTVVGPNYSSRPVCLECLMPVTGDYTCSGCRFPMCSEKCEGGPRHKRECAILGRCTDWPEALRIKGGGEASNAYSVIAPLRVLLLQQSGGDDWARSDQLMDHLGDRRNCDEEWAWYDRYIVDFIRNDLGLADMFTEDQVRRAVGLLNVNAVALHFPRMASRMSMAEDNQMPVGKGLYPIFAIMSHHCVCNARYMINPNDSGGGGGFDMYVRARKPIRKGEEISVQYLSALYGNFKRRKKIKADWHFDCMCKRCSDPTECGSFISAVKCFDCGSDRVLPVDPLDYESIWKCGRCGYSLAPRAVEQMVDGVEEELNEIVRNTTDDNRDAPRVYEEFIARHSGSLLHANHYLLMTAKRNLIQFYTYATPTSDILDLETVRRKLEHCQHFYSVLTKVDPGYSEIRNFVQSELNFSRLYLSQQDFQCGILCKEEYLARSRQSLAALEEVQKNKRLVQFEKI